MKTLVILAHPHPGVYNTREDVEARARDHAEQLGGYITGGIIDELPSARAL